MMNETTKHEASHRPGVLAAALAAWAVLALLAVPARASAPSGQNGQNGQKEPKPRVETVKVRTEDGGTWVAKDDDGKSERREVVVVAGPGDGPDGGVWMTRELGGGYLGVELLPMTEELRAHFGVPTDRGVLVSRVEEDSPAAKAGLQAGDVVVRLDGEKVDTPWDLTLGVRGHKKGDTARLSLWRDGKSMSLDVKLDERERQKVDLGKAFELDAGPGKDGEKRIVRLRTLPPGNGEPPVVFLHPEAMDRLGESLDKVDWPRLNERLGARNRELEKRLDELEKRLDELQKELDASKGAPRS
jgi:hypothetical protein